MAAVGCERSADATQVSVVNLLHGFERAEQRPSSGFEVTTSEIAGLARPAIVAPVPSRATWSLPLPRHGRLRAFVAIAPGTPGGAVRFRVGVSDHRIYEPVAQRTVESASGWTELQADLSAYAGFKWSLFYRPDRIIWRLVLATEPAAGGARAIWGSPEIVTGREPALEYVRRRAELR